MISRTRSMLCVALVVLVAVVGTVVVSAHMALQRSFPEADAVLGVSPDQIQLWFTQDPDPAVSNVSLEGPSGTIEIGETKVMEERSVVAAVPALAAGKYTVGWRSAGDDGHVQRGEFSFTVQAD